MCIMLGECLNFLIATQIVTFLLLSSRLDDESQGIKRSGDKILHKKIMLIKKDINISLFTYYLE